LLAFGGFAVHAGVGGARQHAVLGSEPAFALPAHKWRNLLIDTGSAKHAGIAEFNQHGSFGMTGVMARDANFTQSMRCTSAGAMYGVI
jgi:hypothetical protein